MRCDLRPLLLVAILGISSSAYAIPVRWIIGNNAFLSDGGRMLGSFIYDADLGIYSDIGIATFGGTYPGGYYSVSDPGQQRDPGHSLTAWVSTDGGLLGQMALYLPVIGTLTNAGGNLSLGISVEGLCGEISPLTGGYCLLQQARTGFVGASLVGVPLATVPAPAPMMLFLSAAALLGGLRRAPQL